MGGVAGGRKYAVHSIVFKFAVDTDGFYGSDYAAAKVAGCELRGLMAYFNCNIPRYCGFSFFMSICYLYSIFICLFNICHAFISTYTYHCTTLKIAFSFDGVGGLSRFSIGVYVYFADWSHHDYLWQQWRRCVSLPANLCFNCW